MVKDRSANRWIVSVLSSLAGALLGGESGVVLGRWYVQAFMPFAGLEGLVPPLLGGAIGVIVGSIVGAVGIALAYRRLGLKWTASLVLVLVILGFGLLPAELPLRILLGVLVASGAIGLLVEWIRQARAKPGRDASSGQ